MPQINAQDKNTQPQNQDENNSQGGNWRPEEVPQLTVDVYKQGEVIFVVSTVAGVNPKDLDISVENSTLSIKGVRKKPYSEDKSVMLLEECFWGEFYRELTINENIDVDSIKATINQGVLIIEVPLLKITPHRKIEVDFKN
jgi:HSP20 family protein